jgi:hypothetical protein
MTPEEVLQLCDVGGISPGIDALELLGSRWYESAVEAGSALPVVADVATRFRAARRVLNHVADRFLHDLDVPWGRAA